MKTKSIKINAVLNIIRQCCNIVFPLVIYSYVSTTLGSTNFGKYNFADSIVVVFMILSAIGIPTYAIREGARIRSNGEDISLFAAEVFTINIITLLFFGIILVLCTLTVPRMQNNCLLICILAINMVTNILGRDWINTIYEDYRYTAFRYVLFQIIGIVLVFLFIKKETDYYLYAIIMVIANSGGYILNFFYTQKYIPIKLTKHINIKKHIKPILYLFGVTLAIQIYVKSDIIILGFLQSDSEIGTYSEVGIYSLASKVYIIIKALLNAVIAVAIPRLSSYLGENRKDDYKRLLEQLKSTMSILVFPCAVGLFFESKNVLLLLGGEEYVPGYKALRILCFALLFAVFGCLYSQAILIPNRCDKAFFLATIVAAFLNIVLNIILIPCFGMDGAAVTTVIAELLVAIICMLNSKNLYSKKAHMNKESFSVFIGCGAISIICFLFDLIIQNDRIQLISSISISGFVYIIVLILFKNPIAINYISKCKETVNSFFNRIS